MNPSSEVIRQRLFARTRLRHWLGFARVAELGSVRKAAEAMGMAQPALTTMLADLEALLGAPLFERHARGMRLTRLGRELLPTVRGMLGSAATAAEQAAALQARAAGVVRVGAIGGAVSGLLSLALPELAERHPQLLVQLVEADAPQLDQLIVRGDIDVALCRAPRVVPAGWRFEPLLQDRFAVVAAPGHPLARRRRIGLPLLRQQTWLANPTGSAARAAFDALFADQDPPPALCLVSSRVPGVLWALLQARPVLALVPASVTRQLVAAGQLVELSIDRELPFEPIGALVPAQDAPLGVERLLQALRRVPPMAAAMKVPGGL